MSQLNLHLKVWRQNAGQPGHFQDIDAPDIPDHASFLEMMDIVNERLISKGQEPVAFDHDCREGICGMCSMQINGVPHGPEKATTTCQLHMRKFRTGDTIWVEPFRAKAFPVIKDLVVDRGAFDRIQQAGGFISVRTGAPQDANALPIGKVVADAAMDASDEAALEKWQLVTGVSIGTAALSYAIQVIDGSRLAEARAMQAADSRARRESVLAFDAALARAVEPRP